MKQGFLIISEGTLDPEGREDLRIMKEEIEGRFPDSITTVAFTDENARKALREQEGIKVKGIRAAMLQMKEEGVQSLAAITTEVMESRAFDAEKEEIHGCAALFSEMKIAGPLIKTEEDIPLFSRCMAGVFSRDFQDKVPVAVVEKELAPSAEGILPALEASLRSQLSPEAHVISLMGGKRTKKMLAEIEGDPVNRTIGYIPMSFLGGPAFEERLSDGERSPAGRTRAAGHIPHFHVKGLGAYDEFLRLYLKRLYEACR